MDVGESGCDERVEVRTATSVEIWILEMYPCDQSVCGYTDRVDFGALRLGLIGKGKILVN